MPRVYLPRSLVALFPGMPREIAVEAAPTGTAPAAPTATTAATAPAPPTATAPPTVAGLLAALDRQWLGLWDRLCTAGPEIREHINIFVDGEKATLETPLAPDAVVRIIPAVSGGGVASSGAAMQEPAQAATQAATQVATQAVAVRE